MFRSILGALQGVWRPSEEGIRVLVLQESRKSHLSHVVRAVLGVSVEKGEPQTGVGERTGLCMHWKTCRLGKLHVERECDRSGCDTFEELQVCLREAGGCHCPLAQYHEGWGPGRAKKQPRAAHLGLL